MTGRILSIIAKESGFRCLPCDRINLDIERFSEYRDSDEHPAERPFELPELKSSRRLVPNIPREIPTILRYFLDGSRRTYKVADIIIDGHYLPIVAGQVGVCVVRREDNGNTIAPVRQLCAFKNIIAFPDRANENDLRHLQEQINKQLGTTFELQRYTVKVGGDPVDLGIAKIMSSMHDFEIEAVQKMAQNQLLANDILVIDGPLRFRKSFDLVQFRNVVGLSKTFRPSFTLGKGKSRQDVGSITSNLGFGERTSAYKMVEGDKTIGMWYLRIRPPQYMSNPLQGIVKIESYAIETEEKENGLDGDRIDVISGYILRERNVTPYKLDRRWASHIYPVYMAETYIKDSFMSDAKFQGLF